MPLTTRRYLSEPCSYVLHLGAFFYCLIHINTLHKWYAFCSWCHIWHTNAHIRILPHSCSTHTLYSTGSMGTSRLLGIHWITYCFNLANFCMLLSSFFTISAYLNCHFSSAIFTVSWSDVIALLISSTDFCCCTAGTVWPGLRLLIASTPNSSQGVQDQWTVLHDARSLIQCIYFQVRLSRDPEVCTPPPPPSCSVVQKLRQPLSVLEVRSYVLKNCDVGQDGGSKVVDTGSDANGSVVRMSGAA